MKNLWWKDAVVYQIYPRSFMDSNGDGIGDLRGIISKADYLKELGVDVVWLSPVYASPNADNGYDISDYCTIMKEFGTMADMEALIETFHSRGIRILMDLVVNHSSDEHPWFKESLKDRDNPRADWYLWRDGYRTGEVDPASYPDDILCSSGAPAGRFPPNTLPSFFSGSAWKYRAERDQFYLHLFAVKQPDLNWENPALRRSVYEAMRFWLDKGIDGFRMDVANMYSKNPDFTVFMNGPKIHAYLKEMNREIFSRYDVMTVGETPGVDPREASLYVGPRRRELNMVFQFEHMDVDSGRSGKWDIKDWKLTDLKRILSKWQVELDGRGWNSLYLNNHDQPRMVSRFGNDGVWRKESAKALATMIHTMQGTPYIYQGEELGMTNVRFPRLSDYEDIEIRNYVKESIERDGLTEAELLPRVHYRGRDNARTPMQWDATANAAFTTGKPWLALNPAYKNINARESLEDPDSIFHYYQRLIELRRSYPVIAHGGSFRELMPESEQVYAYERSRRSPFSGERLLVILNLSDVAADISGLLPRIRKMDRLLIDNQSHPDGAERKEAEGTLLGPWEARVYRSGAGSKVKGS